MKKKIFTKQDIKAITFGGLLAAVYLILTLLSIYVIPILAIIGLFVLPIFAAFYASIYNFKNIITFNLATLIICFISGISDPFFTLLYVLPTLIVGDMYGLFNKLHIKFYTTIFLQSITYSITNLLALYLGELLYDTKIIAFILSDPFLYEYFALVILFLLSGAEAIFSTIFMQEQLKTLKISKEKEKQMPLYGYIFFIVFYLLMIVFKLISLNNFFTLFVLFEIILLIPLIIEINKKIKYANIFWLIYVLIFITINFYLCFVNLVYLIPILMLAPLLIYCVVKLAIFIYNINKSWRTK